MSYGRQPEGAKHWREKMLREVGAQLDPIRTHFLGKVPYAGYKRILQVSAAHVYLTYPFVLSWSMLEAMATGCLVIGSDTAPVREVLEDDVNGRLVEMFDPRSIAAAAIEALALPSGASGALRDQARQQALRFSTGAGIAALDGACTNQSATPDQTPQGPWLASRLESISRGHTPMTAESIIFGKAA